MCILNSSGAMNDGVVTNISALSTRNTVEIMNFRRISMMDISYCCIIIIYEAHRSVLYDINACR